MTTSTAGFPLLTGPLKAVAERLGKRWWLLLIPGIAWVIVGFVVLRFDFATVAIVSVVFGIMVLLAAIGEVFSATIAAGGWRVFHIVFAALLLIGAISVFVDPGGALVSLAFVTGIYFVFAGTYDIVSSLLFRGIAEIAAAFSARSAARLVTSS